MIVYSVSSPEGIHYYATQREALRASRALVPDVSVDAVVEVERVELVPMDKAAIVRLINHEGRFVASAQVISRRKGGAK